MKHSEEATLFMFLCNADFEYKMLCSLLLTLINQGHSHKWKEKESVQEIAVSRNVGNTG